MTPKGGDVLIEELDYVEEIIFGVLMGCGAHGRQRFFFRIESSISSSTSRTLPGTAPTSTQVKPKASLKYPYLFKIERTHERPVRRRHLGSGPWHSDLVLLSGNSTSAANFPRPATSFPIKPRWHLHRKSVSKCEPILPRGRRRDG
jgi:hypothetical protein